MRLKSLILALIGSFSIACTEEAEEAEVTLAPKTQVTSILIDKDDPGNEAKFGESIEEIGDSTGGELTQPEFTRFQIFADGTEINKEELWLARLGASIKFTYLGFYTLSDVNEDAEAYSSELQLLEEQEEFQVNLTENAEFEFDAEVLSCVSNKLSVHCRILNLVDESTVSFTVNGQTTTRKFKVTDPGMTAIGLNPAKNEIALNDELELKIMAFYALGFEEDISAEATLELQNPDSEILKLGFDAEKGVYTIKGISAGEETLLLSYKNLEQEWLLKVTGPALVALRLEELEEEAISEEPFKFKVIGEYADKLDREITDRVIFDFNDDSCSREEPGSLYFICTAGDKELSVSFLSFSDQQAFEVELGISFSNFYLTKETLYVPMGATRKGYAVGIAEEGQIIDISDQVEWALLGRGVVEMAEDGTLTPIQLGTVQVSARFKDFPPAILQVEVIEPQPIEVYIKSLDDLEQFGKPELKLDDYGNPIILSNTCADELELRLFGINTIGEEVELTHSEHVTWVASNTAAFDQILDNPAIKGKFVSKIPGLTSISAFYEDPYDGALLSDNIRVAVTLSSIKNIRAEFSSTIAVGREIDFRALGQRTCNIEEVLSLSYTSWEITSPANDPGLSLSLEATKIATSGDLNVLSEDSFTVKVTYTPEGGSPLTATQDVTVLPPVLDKLQWSVDGLETHDGALLLYDDAPFAMPYFGTLTNGTRLEYSEMLAAGISFTYNEPDTFTFDVSTGLATLTQYGESRGILKHTNALGENVYIRKDILAARRCDAADYRRTPDGIHCIYQSAAAQSCSALCISLGMDTDADTTINILGSEAANPGICSTVARSFNPSYFINDSLLNLATGVPGEEYGCSLLTTNNTVLRVINLETDLDAAGTIIRRFCACK